MAMNKQDADRLLAQRAKVFAKAAITLVKPTLGHAVIQLLERGEAISNASLQAEIQRILDRSTAAPEQDPLRQAAVAALEMLELPIAPTA
jgi:hypothetical protein